jgi:hypothetical protein
MKVFVERTWMGKSGRKDQFTSSRSGAKYSATLIIAPAHISVLTGVFLHVSSCL